MPSRTCFQSNMTTSHQTSFGQVDDLNLFENIFPFAYSMYYIVAITDDEFRPSASKSLPPTLFHFIETVFLEIKNAPLKNVVHALTAWVNILTSLYPPKEYSSFLSLCREELQTNLFLLKEGAEELRTLGCSLDLSARKIEKKLSHTLNRRETKESMKEEESFPVTNVLPFIFKELEAWLSSSLQHVMGLKRPGLMEGIVTMRPETIANLVAEGSSDLRRRSPYMI